MRSEIEEIIGKNISYVIRNIDDKELSQRIIDGMLDQLEHLLSTQVEESRIDELEKLSKQWEYAYDGDRAVSLDIIKDRIVALKKDVK